MPMKKSRLAEDRYPSRGTQLAGLYRRHDPVVYAAEETPAPLPAKSIEAYRRDGFLVLDDLFSEREVGLFQEELARLRGNALLARRPEVISERDSSEIRSIFRVHNLSAVFARLVADQRLAGLAAYLLGDEVYVHQSRLNYKPGLRGREFYWHSDFETWHVEDGMPSMRALSMSIALTPNYECNGPLLLIPGSHQHYVACGGRTPANHYQRSLQQQEYGVPDDDSLAELVQRGGIVSATGRPGSVTIFDCNTMHGSGSNISPYPRSNLFVVYNALGNRLRVPFCDQPPRPEFIAARQSVSALQPCRHSEEDYAL